MKMSYFVVKAGGCGGKMNKKKKKNYFYRKINQLISLFAQ